MVHLQGLKPLDAPTPAERAVEAPLGKAARGGLLHQDAMSSQVSVSCVVVLRSIQMCSASMDLMVKTVHS